MGGPSVDPTPTEAEAIGVVTANSDAAQAEAVADETVPGSRMNGQPANLQAALVAVEPGTGRVLATDCDDRRGTA